MKTAKLNPSQAWHLQWVAAAYPGPFREISRSAAMNSLARKGLATKRPADGVRRHRGRTDRLADFKLTSEGLKALETIDSDLFKRVSALVCTLSGV